jgi:RNA polymerase sigma-70 factor (sigma-E family)
MMTTQMGAPEPPLWDDPLVELYRARYEPMVRLAYLLTGDRAVAEELVQDAFVSLHRNWARATNPAAYLRTSVVNATRSWGRHRTLELHRRPAPTDPSVLVADEMWDALQVLPVRQRTAIVLRFYEDLPDARIAELLGCREGTVRTAIHRGLARLRKEIEP